MSSLQPNKRQCADVLIDGMHCESCSLLLEQKLKAVKGVTEVSVDYRTGMATIEADAGHLPTERQISEAVKKAGYSLSKDGVGTADSRFPSARGWLEIGVSLIILIALWKVLQSFDVVSLAPSTFGPLTAGSIVVIGLVAGTSSCLAVTGGLLLSMAAAYNQNRTAITGWQKFQPLLHFNVGRLLSYAVLGGVVGFVGQSLSLTPRITGVLNILIAFVMIYLALSILHLLPRGRFSIVPRSVSRRIAALSSSDHPVAPFALGALTFFLPCGFTQSLQLAALGSGSFLNGAVIMGAFAVGTLPSLIGISLLSSAANGNVGRLFLKFSGVAVLALGVFSLNSGFLLTGIDVPRSIETLFGVEASAEPLPPIVDGAQDLHMAVFPNTYEPSNLSVRSGMPVRWTIDGTSAAGCTSTLVIPELNIVKPIFPGLNVLEFVPEHPGTLAFSCSVGRVHGSINVL